jgi:YD repeat-containing protein
MPIEDQVAGIFGARGVPEAPRVTVNVITGSLKLGMTPPALSAAGFPVNIDFSYDTPDSYLGILGLGHAALGEVGEQVVDLTAGDRNGVVVLRQSDGDVKQFTGKGDGATWLSAPPPTGMLVKKGDNSWALQRTDLYTDKFDAYGFIYSTINPEGAAHYYYYDGPGTNELPLKVGDASGRYCYFDYSGSVAQKFRDWGGRATYFAYDGNSNLTKITNPDSTTTYFKYDGNNNVSAILTPDNNAAYFAYNSSKVSRQYVPAFGTTYYYYDTVNKVSKVQNARGLFTYFFYNDSTITKITDALLQTTQFAGTNTVQPPGTGVGPSYFIYDKFGNPIQNIDALGNSTKAAFDDHYRRLLNLDANQNATYYAYDAFGNLVKQQDALGNPSYFAYDSSGQRIRAQNENKATTYFYYDNYGNVVKQYDRLLNLTYFEYDALGNAVKQIDPRGAVTYFGYNAMNRPTQQLRLAGPYSTYWSYLPTGSVAASLDARGGATYFAYDAFAAVRRRMDPLNAAVYYQYDAVGNRVAQLNENNAPTYYRYDALDRMDAALNPDNSSTYFYYDPRGNSIATADERLFLTYFQYDANNRLVATRDPLGGSAYFAYDPVGNRSRAENALLNTTYFGYDALNRQARSLDALNRATYFKYDAVSNLAGVLRPGPQTEYYAYDAMNRMVARLDPANYPSYFAYDANGNTLRRMDPRQNTTYFGYDLLNRNTVIQDASGQPSYFAYDPNDNLVAMQDHISGLASAATYFGYDANNHRVQSLDALNRAAYFAYDPVGNLARMLAPGSLFPATYYQYDSRNHLVATLQPAQRASYFGYDAAGNTVQVLNPRSFASYFAYDALNRRAKSQDALTKTTYFGYNANSNLVKTLDRRLNATYFTYDVLDRLATTQDALQNVTARWYTQAGDIYAFTYPVGNPTYFTYDPRRLLTSAIDGVGNVTGFSYDPAGNRAQAISPRGYATYFGYDALNRVSRTQAPNTADFSGAYTYFGYDSGGNLYRTQDVLGRATYFNYDVLNRLVSTEDPLLNSSYFGYDLAGNRAAEMNARQFSSYFGYDAANRLTAAMDPLQQSAYYAYDANSNLARSLDRNSHPTYFGYDALGRRTSLFYATEGWGIQPWGISAYGGGEPQYFAYDAESNLTTLSDDWGPSYFGYDVTSRLTQRVTPRADAVYYAYDGSSNLLKLQYPQDGQTCYYGYDGAQRMYKLLTTQSNSCYYTYDASSNVIQKTLGNGMVSWGAFDTNEQFTSLRYVDSLGGTVAYFDYGRDAAGRITRLARETDLAHYYSYDDGNRLLSEVWRKKSDSSQIYAFTYNYDATNNRLAYRKETTAGTEYESAYFAYDKDDSLIKRQVTTPAPSAVNTYFYYDKNGALTTQVEAGSPTYFAYAGNQLISRIAPPTGNPWNFSYDAQLNRYSMDRGGTVRYLLWDGLNLLEERNANGTLYARYSYGYSRIYGIGSCVEVYLAGLNKTYTLVLDHRGTAYMALDGTTVIATRYYDAFGVILGSTGTWPVDLGYQTGWQTLQIGTETYCFSRNRIFVPRLGIFTQRDFLPFLNKYRAFGNNPVGQVDKNGLGDVDTNDDTQAFRAQLFAIVDKYQRRFNAANVPTMVFGNTGNDMNPGSYFTEQRPPTYASCAKDAIKGLSPEEKALLPLALKFKQYVDAVAEIQRQQQYQEALEIAQSQTYIGSAKDDFGGQQIANLGYTSADVGALQAPLLAQAVAPGATSVLTTAAASYQFGRNPTAGNAALVLLSAAGAFALSPTDAYFSGTLRQGAFSFRPGDFGHIEPVPALIPQFAYSYVGFRGSPAFSNSVFRAGHVGFSLEGGPLYAFNPIISSAPSSQVLGQLRNEAVFPGQVTNDELLFAEAFRTVKTKTFEYRINYSTYRKALAQFEMDRILGTSKLYSFPPFKAPNTYNCATYPSSIGLPIPKGAESGILSDFLPRQ